MVAAAEKFEAAPVKRCLLLLLDSVGETFALADYPVLIGRGRHVDIRLNDRYVSRIRCEIASAGKKSIVHYLDLTAL